MTYLSELIAAQDAYTVSGNTSPSDDELRCMAEARAIKERLEQIASAEDQLAAFAALLTDIQNHKYPCAFSMSDTLFDLACP